MTTHRRGRRKNGQPAGSAHHNKHEDDKESPCRWAPRCQFTGTPNQLWTHRRQHAGELLP